MCRRRFHQGRDANLVPRPRFDGDRAEEVFQLQTDSFARGKTSRHFLLGKRIGRRKRDQESEKRRKLTYSVSGGGRINVHRCRIAKTGAPNSSATNYKSANSFSSSTLSFKAPLRISSETSSCGFCFNRPIDSLTAASITLMLRSNVSRICGFQRALFSSTRWFQ